MEQLGAASSETSRCPSQGCSEIICREIKELLGTLLRANRSRTCLVNVGSEMLMFDAGKSGLPRQVRAAGAVRRGFSPMKIGKTEQMRCSNSV